MGRKRKQTSRKLNNRGMTLIEVLVAMMMLSVVSLVFLRSFSQTMFYNRNAREKQYALTVAQSMMEGMKAYSMDSLDSQFSAAPETFRSTFRLYPLNNPMNEHATGRIDGAEGYVIEGIKAGNFTFDVSIKVEPAPAATEASQLYMVTAAPLAGGSDRNKYNDGFYVQSGREQDAVYEKVVETLKAVDDMHSDEKELLTKETVDWSYVDLKIETRTLKVEIGSSTVTVKNVFHYKFNITDYPYRRNTDPSGVVSGTFSLDTPSEGDVMDSGVECYNNTNTAAADSNVKLENLYLYYYPAYSHNKGGLIKCDDDVIEITNNTGRIVNVYAVKQQNGALRDTELAFCESDYSVTVQLRGNEKINLYHNLMEKLAGSGSGSYTCSSFVWGKAIEDKRALWETGVAGGDRTLVYKVKVTVKEHGTGKEIYELSGTVNEK